MSDLVKRAHEEIKALCAGERRWTMSIPARPDYDSDLLIAGALRELEHEIGYLKAKLENMGIVLETLHTLLDEGVALRAETTGAALEGKTAMAYIYDALTFEPEH